MLTPRGKLIGLFTGIMLVFTPHAHAQSGALVGTVLDQGTLEPLAGATISIPNTRIAAKTDRNGNFSIPAVPAGATRMHLEAPGFSGMVEDVQITADGVAYAQFQMMSLEFVLDGVRAFGRPEAGTPSPTERRVRESEDALTAADLLARQVPGVSVTSSGAAGGQGRILIRGVRSINTSSEPTIFLNGVRITSPAGAARNVIQVLSRIPARDVSRIQVLHGASAGAIYSDSANGVILIETRSDQPQ